ncbi:hypothetical protein CARUB_v10028663mg, partial [Capsella rubella]
SIDCYIITHFDLRNELALSMVFIRDSTDIANDDDLAIFPPINHENLYIDGFKSSSSSTVSVSSSSSSLLYPSDLDEHFGIDLKSRSQFSETIGKSLWKSILEIDIVQGWWWKLLLARVLSKFQNLVTCFSRNSLCSFSITLRSSYPFMIIVIWWLMRYRTRQREIVAANLRDKIKERDERELFDEMLK